MPLDDILKKEPHERFEEQLRIYQQHALSPQAGSTEVPIEHVRAAKAMIRMVCDEPLGINYEPRCAIPEELEQQFDRIRNGSASPTHALEALVGGEAIGRLNVVEGRVGRSAASSINLR